MVALSVWLTIFLSLPVHVRSTSTRATNLPHRVASEPTLKLSSNLSWSSWNSIATLCFTGRPSNESDVERIRRAAAGCLGNVHETVERKQHPKQKHHTFEDAYLYNIMLLLLAGMLLVHSSGPTYFQLAVSLLSLVCVATRDVEMAALFQRLSSCYWELLETHPIIMKSLSTGSLASLGDSIAQWTELNLITSKFQGHKGGDRKYSIRRGLSVFLDGLLVSGPLMHFCYQGFEWIIPTGGDFSWFAAMAHVVADTLLLDSCCIVSTICFTGLLEGISVPDLLQQLRNEYFSSVKVSWLTSTLLFPIQFWCFWRLPINARVLSVNCMDVLWDATVSLTTHRSRSCCRYQSG